MIPDDEARTTGGRVSMEEEISSTGLNTLGREEVRMFSGAGMV